MQKIQYLGNMQDIYLCVCGGGLYEGGQKV